MSDDVQCWHIEPGTPCDWNACRQPERLAAGDIGTDPLGTPPTPLLTSQPAEAVAMFPPLCPRCETQHVNHCEDAAFERELWVAMGNRIRAGLAALSRAPMANVPPALRGPRWRTR